MAGKREQTLSEKQNAEMAAKGYNHVCDEDYPDPELSPENQKNFEQIDATFTGAGYFIALGIAYEKDGKTVKPGFIRIFYN